MKCALVTGGSRGIGKAVAFRIASMGYHVLLNFRENLREAEETKETILSSGYSAELLQFDVGRQEEVNHVLGGWLQEHPDHSVDILVNNAGIRDDVLLMWMETEQWSQVLNTNLNSFYFITRLILDGMIRRKFGRIINIVSLSGIKGLPGQVNYAASKAGVIGATKVLALEVARRGITVNAVAPGFISTDMTKDLNEQELKKQIPMQRFGAAEEVAELVAFLASENASYITGQTISIDGGMS